MSDRSPDPNPSFDDLSEELARLEASLREEEDQQLQGEDAATELRLEQEREARKKLFVVLEVARSLNGVERIEELVELMLGSALEISEMDRAVFFQRDAEGQIELAASRVRDRELRTMTGEVEVSHTILNRVIEESKTYYVSDASTDPNFRARRSVQDLSLRTVVCVPITGPSGVMGALYLDSQRAAGLLGEDGVRIMEAFAAQAGIALEAMAHRKELQEAADSLELENRNLKEVLGVRTRYDNLIGQSAAMQKVFAMLERVAERPVTVLIRGGTGTGKDLVARALHFNSPRREANFISVNCAAIPDALLESELFGYRKGAFTGAERDHVGLVEAADGGTLFLDEIGDLSLALQAKLLRVLQENEVRRLGESKDRKVDVRFLAATHRNLTEEVRQKRFREDLYYRLNVITIHLPALRERKEDIMLLAEHFLSQQAELMGRAGLAFSAEARRMLLAYDWPGNVRELQAAVMRAAALSDLEVLTPEDLLPDLNRAAPVAAPRGATLKDSLERAEEMLILDALKDSDGNVSAAARSLGVSRQHLHTRIRRLDLKDKY